MKNQYFGDVNDYKKYGLLRRLTGNGAIKTFVCWMLTKSDNRSDGNKTAYLENPGQWRHHDPDLFDSLAKSLRSTKRDVKQAEHLRIIPRARYYPTLLYDDAESRTEYFQNMYTTAGSSDLIFFDPDNGLEVKSTQKGKRGSSKYIYWDELSQSFELGYSLLVYQHFPRVSREKYLCNLKTELARRMGIHDPVFFQTSFVLFFLLPQPRHEKHLRNCICEIDERWNKGSKPLLGIRRSL
jgi:hypothetical protein